MKKFIIFVAVAVVLFIFFDTAHYKWGWYIDFSPDVPVAAFMKTDETTIYMDQGGGYEPFLIKGVNLGSGIPGQWATDFAIDKETYLRWFRYIKEMGANTIRVYTIQDAVFYNAFYEYNRNNPDPLFLLHGVWVNDYVQNSHLDAYAPEFFDAFLTDCRSMVDVIHGNKKINSGHRAYAGIGTYKKDVSPWVIGYILGVEWEGQTVEYTNQKYLHNESYLSYHGEYLYTAEGASPFEVLLARVGDKVIEYESKKYKKQRLVAFSNWPTTDPFDYSFELSQFFAKCAKVDVEHIKTTDRFLCGMFASYHVYPYYPDYLHYVEDWESYGLADKTLFLDDEGRLNTYKAYLSLLTAHHTIPVVISEFGVSSARGIAQVDVNTGRNQGHLSESEQGGALINSYLDILDAGCAGGCVFSWQDEWFKRTWNTMHAINMMRNPYWSDYQTNEQYFGLLSFDPGEEKSICYVDGDISEWTQADRVVGNEETFLSVKYDVRFVYFLVYKKNFAFGEETLYIPIDTTPKSGSTYCENYRLLFDRACDFLVVIDGRDHSSVQVQERYDALRSTFSRYAYGFNTYAKENIPDKNSPLFVDIRLMLKLKKFEDFSDIDALGETFHTGRLTYGNANPESESYNSLADFIVSGDYVEIKLPWQLLNFADPSRMTIHDDYYDGHYGIDYINIDRMYVGLSTVTDRSRIMLGEKSLTGWGNRVAHHERLKPSYYILQSLWRDME